GTDESEGGQRRFVGCRGKPRAVTLARIMPVRRPLQPEADLFESRTREPPDSKDAALRTRHLEAAAAFLHMHPEEVRSRAKRGLLPGAKAGRRWVFLEVDLAEYLRARYPRPRQALRVTRSEETVCHYANAVASGGSTSRRQAASEY